MRTHPILVPVLALAVGAGCGEPLPTDPEGPNASPTFAGVESTSSAVFVFPAGPQIAGASARLQRSKNGVNAWFQTTGLQAGHAYTLWAVAFNHPGECIVANACSLADVMSGDPAVGVDLINAASLVAGSSGKGTLAGRVNTGELGIQGVGLLDAFEAEIHLVVRDHGPKLPGNAQLSEFGGGCGVYPCANVQVAASFAG